MKAIIGCAIPGKEWFVQLRTPAARLPDQTVISTATGDTREAAIERAMQFGGVTEIVGEYPGVAAQTPRGVFNRVPVTEMMRRLGRRYERLL